MKENSGSSKYLVETLECAACGGVDTIVLEEEQSVADDKVYASGTTLCAKCRTPTMVKIFRWTKWKESG
jgi:ribosomal protein L37E